MSVQHANLIDGSAGPEPEGSSLSVMTTLGAVGYAAFALLQPIPLEEIVPFQTVMAAFEAEAAALAAVPAVPAVVDVPAAPTPPVKRLEAALEVLALVETPEPVVYTVGGYRPSTYTEGGYHPVPLEPTLAGPDTLPVTSGKPVIPDYSLQPSFAVSVTPATDDTVLREVVELVATPMTSTTVKTPAVAPDEVDEVEAPARAKSFTVGGYAADGASDDSRARQVLDELSFLFNED